MVRGLDYYTGTTFEFVHSGLGAQSGIGGGGRYDGLMELLGGSKLSGIGFGLGIDRILLALEAEAESGQLLPGELKYIDLYVIALGDQARTKCFTLVDSLRKEGFVVEQNFGDRSLKAAMKAADKSGARFAIVLGDSELESASVELKEMSSGELTSVRLTSLAKTLAEKSSGL
jgi:histidyl-tRNA synthetase